ncbi:MAG TPA: murein biosynthesis integral membrane protein MurJ [Candidatus Syntrophosphaera sp.]|jgi:putative peptidoglycan lipid II flippase|nr:murein biosynthesis integral membrane protein MurJ [Candidatus Cloacimonadota bacterium]HOR02566.1 murein biosynthesis integral membrane protein MurJ [Candidatus Syntrophosphaera sp.]HPK82539.1 murein biosynthesis integral membrane protein MurJ [Candidatus Syntrophosphaera sp.]HQG93675.1 murein biosynthesis integral membrane protein MurJ [Candidatus Syntrophosphaera sp.]HQK29281.1 murein biosynthesis integral membrane protein MurJ [Candidatus Syntrophosphaera sp.]
MAENKLIRNISMMSVAILISRVLGLVRDQLMAFFFGTTFLNDAFVVGYKIPNLLRNLFGEGALSASFVPIYNEIGIKEDRRKQIDFALQILGILSVFLLTLTVIGIIFAPWIVKLLYPGLAPHTYKLAVLLTRVMFPYLLWIGLSSTMIAILNSHDRFFMTGLSSALLNVGMILIMVVPRFVFGLQGEQLVRWAAWGVFGGGFLQTVINFPYLKQLGYPFKLFVRFGGEALNTMWKRFLPSMIGVGVREINIVADSLMASFLAVGSISALEYGYRLFQFPLGMFAVSTGTVLLPTYSRLVTMGNWEELSKNLRVAAVNLIYLMLPITTLIIALGGDLVQVVFQRGAFDAKASLWTEQALIFYSLGLIFFSFNQTLTPLFFANKDTRTPVKISASMVGLNIVLNFILMQFMQHRGLAFATSITAMVNFSIQFYLLRKKMPHISFAGILPNFLKTLGICVLMLVLLLVANHFYHPRGFWPQLIKLGLLGTASLLFFYGLGLLLKLDFLAEARDRLWNKFRRK